MIDQPITKSANRVPLHLICDLYVGPEKRGITSEKSEIHRCFPNNVSWSSRTFKMQLIQLNCTFESDINSQLQRFSRRHEAVFTCSWRASCTCFASFRFLFRIRFFYDKEGEYGVQIRADRSVRIESKKCNRCRARETLRPVQTWENMNQVKKREECDR